LALGHSHFWVVGPLQIDPLPTSGQHARQKWLRRKGYETGAQGGDGAAG